MVIFKILNKISGQLYVGTCRNEIDERWALYVQAAEAGLDFPLYQEIRQFGQHAFEICELDFADSNAELKELELLHTIELGARSLRSYKFGRSDQVIKRRKTSEQFLDWMKDLEPSDEDADSLEPLELELADEKPRSPDQSRSTDAKAAQAEIPQTQPAPTRPQVKLGLKLKEVTRTTDKPQQNNAQTKPQNQTKTTTQAAPVDLNSKPTSAAETTTDNELEKSVFAEGMGLLARALQHNQQLELQRQLDQRQINQLQQTLSASQQGLEQQQQRLEQLENQVQQTLSAVETSLQAVQATLLAQQQLDLCYDSQNIAHPSEPTSTPSLQDQFEQLMKRLKNSAETRTAVNNQCTPVQPANPEPTVEPVAAVAKTEELKPAALDPIQVSAASEQSQYSTTTKAQPLPAQPETTEEICAESAAPARAWVAPGKGQQNATEFAVDNQQATKIVRRRTKALSRENPINPQAARPSGPRKRLSIRSSSTA